MVNEVDACIWPPNFMSGPLLGQKSMVGLMRYMVSLPMSVPLLAGG
jgi:hypothetical protein